MNNSPSVIQSTKPSTRNQILGVRATNQFVNKFDELCERLGHNRSEVIRYVLKRFLNEHWNHSENFKRARNDLF